MSLGIDGIVDEELAALNAMPLEELRWRMAIVTELTGTDASCSQETVAYRFPSATRYAWNDSGGTSLLVYVTDDGRALLLTFSPEHVLNIGFGPRDHDYLRAMLRGVPADLLRLTEEPGQSAGCYYPDLGLTDPHTGRQLIAATGVFWYDGERWHHASDGMLEACALEGIDPYEEPNAMSSVFCAGHEFTPQHYFACYFAGIDLPPEERPLVKDLIHAAFERHSR